jgi:histidine triad (HIT) family protein
MAEHGVLQIPDDQMAQLAQRIGEAYRFEFTAR